jgi:hypothetical protein
LTYLALNAFDAFDCSGAPFAAIGGPSPGLDHGPPASTVKDIDMQHSQPPPDQAMAEHPLEYTDPDLRAYTEEQAEDMLESIIHYMPIVLPLTAALLIFMLAFIAVYMG